jgi:hypothetical protein
MHLKPGAVSGGVLVVLLLAGCASSPMSIRSVVKNAGALNGTTVTVQGRVRTGAALFGNGAYQLDDGTATIWVLTRNGTPAANGKRTVDGKVRQALHVGSFQVVGLEEVNRH